MVYCYIVLHTGRTYSAGGNVDIDTVVKDVISWLARTDNTDWLLIFDNIDREYDPCGTDPDAYDVRGYLPDADHGSILITTRLAKLEQLGSSQQLGKVNRSQAEAIFQSRYKRKYGKAYNKLTITKI